MIKRLFILFAVIAGTLLSVHAQDIPEPMTPKRIVNDFTGLFSTQERAALEKKLTHNLDHELNRFSKQIRKAIAEEIVKRHYFQRGVILERMKDDANLTKAIETLKDKEGYTKILSVPADK